MGSYNRFLKYVLGRCSEFLLNLALENTQGYCSFKRCVLKHSFKNYIIIPGKKPSICYGRSLNSFRIFDLLHMLTLVFFINLRWNLVQRNKYWKCKYTVNGFDKYFISTSSSLFYCYSGISANIRNCAKMLMETLQV